MDENIVKTGTTTIGILCKEGIILAADKRATAGYLIVDKHVDKIYKITDNIAVTIAGSVSDVQLLVKLIKAEITIKKMRTEKEPTVKETANLLARMVYANIRRFSLIPGISHFIIGGKDKTGFHLYDIFPDGSVTECKDFLSTGSGSVMAYGVLETLYEKDLTLDECVKLAIKSVNAAIQRDIGSGQGIDVVAITNAGIKKVLTKELDTKIKA